MQLASIKRIFNQSAPDGLTQTGSKPVKNCDPSKIPYWGRLKLIFSLLFICLTINLFAEDTEKSPKLPLHKTDTLFLVSQSIYLDAEKITHKAPFEKLEAAFKIKILNQYIPLTNGTAFLVDEQGHLLTAAQFLKKLSPRSKMDLAEWSFSEFLAKHMCPDCFTEKELNTLFMIYTKHVKNSEPVISAKATNKKDYEVQLIAENTDLDLALLKIALKDKIEPLAFESAASGKKGDIVFATGYALPFLMDKFLAAFKPEIIPGSVVLYQDDTWEILFNTPLVPCTSGSPLLTSQGKLLGINLVKQIDGKVFHSVLDAKKIREWLHKISESETVENKELP